MRNDKIPVYCLALVIFLMGNSGCGLAASESPERLVAQLLELDDATGETWDEVIDALADCGAEAFAALEARGPEFADPQHVKERYLLEVAQSMLSCPMNKRGVHVTSVGVLHTGENPLKVGMILLAMNGRPLTCVDDFMREWRPLYAQVRAKAKGAVSQLVFDVWYRGEETQVVLPGIDTRIRETDYPNLYVEYLNFGHRGQIWDEATRRALWARLYLVGQSAAKSLEESLRAGCGDPLVCAQAIAGYRAAGMADEAVAVWETNHAKLHADRYLGRMVRRARLEAGMAYLESGDRDQAEVMLRALMDDLGTTDKRFRAQTSCALAGTLRRTAPGEAVGLIQGALPDLGDGERYHWGNVLVDVLIRQRDWATLDKTRDHFHPGLDRHIQAGIKPLFDDMVRHHAAVDKAMPEHWALVYRQNFEVPQAARAIQDRQDFRPYFQPHDGALLMHAPEMGISFFNWDVFDRVRVRADIQMLQWEDHPEWLSRFTSLNALFSYERGSEIGCGPLYPRGLSTFYGFSANPLLIYNPELDARGPHEVVITCDAGQAVYSIDGTDVFTQVVDPKWWGRCGIRCHDCTARLDNYEISVPSDAPVDNEAIRALYDSASSRFNEGQMDASLGDLEQVADLQPQRVELARLYAAYVLAAHPNRADALAVLVQRRAQITASTGLELLSQAELHVDLLTLDTDRYLRYFELHNDIADNVKPTKRTWKGVKNPQRPGEWSLYNAWQMIEKKAKPDETVAGYRKAADQHPDSLLCQWDYYTALKRLDRKDELPAVQKRLQALAPSVSW